MTRGWRAASLCLHYLKELGLYDEFIQEMCRINGIQSKHVMRIIRQRLEEQSRSTEDKAKGWWPSLLLRYSGLSFPWAESRHGKDYWIDVADKVDHLWQVRNGKI